MKKKNTYTCGLEATLALIEGKWKILILRSLSSGTRRFNELHRLINGISEKMLIQELKEMVADGIAQRKDFNESPPKVEYSLTAFGISLAAACEPLCSWGSDHMEYIVSLTELSPTPDGKHPAVEYKKEPYTPLYYKNTLKL